MQWNDWLRYKKKQTAALSGRKVLLESTLVLLLLGRGLESTVSELGRGVDPLEADLLEGPSGGLGEHGLSEGHDTLLDTRDGTLEHDEVVLDLTVADETTKTVIYLVVDRGSVMVTHLTGTGNSPLDVGRMPSTNTSDLSETLVGLARKLLGTPTGSDTVETVTLGDGDDVNHLVLLEDAGNIDGLLEELLTERDLVGDAATVDLDLHKVGLLLLERGLSDLGVGEDTDDGAVLLDTLKLAGDGSTVVLGVLLGVLGESLLLGLVPVLVESALDLVAQMLGPNGGEGSQASGGLDVANQTNNDHLKDVGDEQHQKGGSSRRHDEELIQVDEALRDVTPQAGELPRDAELQMSCGGSCPEEV
ncbi:hypothetical protein HG531_006144 [Fusarium graminearum]|nr:hypothetical protein HG531_006144 [Fusarium graminearum]